MNIKKVNLVVKLQNQVNDQIDKFGKAYKSSANRLEKLADSLTYEEIDEVIKYFVTEK